MKTLLVVTSLVLGCVVAVAEERRVVVPEDTTPFPVEKSDIVRLSGQGIAGSSITAKVDGPAKILAENTVVRKVKGNSPLGITAKEFEIEPTGNGKVSVTITVKPPQPDAKPRKETYTFTVE